MSTAPDLFSYGDYRAFLRDWYAHRKAHGRVSYRSFAQRAKIGSPSYLKLVMDGQRNITPAMAQRFASACALDAEASAFFCELVRFNQADSPAERRAAYARLRSFPRYRELHPLEMARDEYHSSWFLPAVREMVACHGFTEDPAVLAGQLMPPIKPAEAERALRTLLELGLVVRGADGRLRQGEALVSSGDAASSVHLGNYHRQMIQRAAESLDTIPRAQRDISSVTLAVDETTLGQIVDAIAGFRRQLLELAATTPEPTRVVQVNLQLFPLTRDTKNQR